MQSTELWKSMIGFATVVVLGGSSGIDDRFASIGELSRSEGTRNMSDHEPETDRSMVDRDVYVGGMPYVRYQEQIPG